MWYGVVCFECESPNKIYAILHKRSSFYLWYNFNQLYGNAWMTAILIINFCGLNVFFPFASSFLIKNRHVFFLARNTITLLNSKYFALFVSHILNNIKIIFVMFFLLLHSRKFASLEFETGCCLHRFRSFFQFD